MDINTFFKKQNSKNQVKILTCGSVDDGKSTLIGRLLFDSKSIFHDQISQAEYESEKYGTQGKDIDLALLIDGLQAEREQGITIDVPSAVEPDNLIVKFLNKPDIKTPPFKSPFP